MLPFIFVLFWTFEEKLEKAKLKETVWRGLEISFVISFTIEMLQLFLRLGTWQLSDIFYNTLGGGIGGLLYYVFHKVKQRSFDSSRKDYACGKSHGILLKSSHTSPW